MVTESTSRGWSCLWVVTPEVYGEGQVEGDMFDSQKAGNLQSSTRSVPTSVLLAGKSRSLLKNLLSTWVSRSPVLTKTSDTIIHVWQTLCMQLHWTGSRTDDDMPSRTREQVQGCQIH